MGTRAAFQIFKILQSSQLFLPNLLELSITFSGTVQSWIEYADDPMNRQFQPWKTAHSNLPALKKLRLDFSESRMQTVVSQIFKGFENWSKSSSLECLELDFFINQLTEKQLIDILEKVNPIKSLKKFSIHLGKSQGVKFSEEVIDAFEDLFKSLINLESVHVNLSCIPSVATPILLSRFLEAITQNKSIRDLKLSLKNCALNDRSSAVLEIFLQEMKSRLQHLDLDLSYNGQMTGNTTSSLCAVVGSFTELRSFAINLKGADNTFQRSDYFLLMGLVRKIFQQSFSRVNNKSNQQINLGNNHRLSTERDRSRLSAQTAITATTAEPENNPTCDDKDTLLLREASAEKSEQVEQEEESVQPPENEFMQKISIQLPLAFIRSNLSLCTQNNQLIATMIKRGPYIFHQMLQQPVLATWRIDILVEAFLLFLA